MPKQGITQLNSFRLAGVVSQVECYICGERNNENAEKCRHCSAPMSLAIQAKSQKVHPTMIAMLGSRSAGKTSYLGMLIDMLSRQNQQLHLIANGPSSIEIQQSTIAALRQGRFPETTPEHPSSWLWLACQVHSNLRRKPFDVVLPDMSGEAVANEVNREDECPLVRAYLGKCAGALIVVDATKVLVSEREEDFSVMKTINYLCELHGDQRKGWSNRPVAIVYTKTDQCESCLEDVEAFTKQHLKRLWQHCQDHLKRHRFFATTLAGACAFRWKHGERVDLPLRIEPRGVIEPFEWLLNELA